MSCKSNTCEARLRPRLETSATLLDHDLAMPWDMCSHPLNFSKSCFEASHGCKINPCPSCLSSRLFLVTQFSEPWIRLKPNLAANGSHVSHRLVNARCQNEKPGTSNQMVQNHQASNAKDQAEDHTWASSPAKQPNDVERVRQISTNPYKSRWSDLTRFYHMGIKTT